MHSSYIISNISEKLERNTQTKFKTIHSYQDIHYEDNDFNQEHNENFKDQQI